MKSFKCLLIILGFTVFSSATAQIAVYGSYSYGYYQNALYNYQKHSDQLQQGYIEGAYLHSSETSNLKIVYNGGLTLFNRFHLRNYYEHKCTTEYTLLISKPVSSIDSLESTTTDDEHPEEEDSLSDTDNDTLATEEDSVQIEEKKMAENKNAQEEESEKSDGDSIGTYFFLSLGAAARHDKNVFEDFDNVGAEGTVFLRSILHGDIFYRLGSEFTYRNYNFVKELSYLSNTIVAQASVDPPDDFSYGIVSMYGWKWFTHTGYDTSMYETVRTYVQVSSGKGKFGKTLVPSSKKVLLGASATYSSQLTAGIYLRREWESTQFSTSFIYRYNPHDGTRYLAQDSTASLLTDDLYKYYFSYKGYGAAFTIGQRIPYNITITLSVQTENKNFGVPAVTINGDQLPKKRKDLETKLTLSLTRTFSPYGAFNCDCTLAAGYDRNETNDEYNNYSGYSVGLSMGISL